MKKFFRIIRWLHKWPSLLLSMFFIIWALSGIVLNHRNTFSRFEVNRSWLPQEYHFQNWNNAAIKGILDIDPKKRLIYGDIGIWLHDNETGIFKSIHEGFNKGIDNRKIHCMLHAGNGHIYAGARTGLYRTSGIDKKWERIQLSVNEPVVAITETKNGILCMTRSHVFRIGDNANTEMLDLHPPDNYVKEVSLFKTIWVIHSGELYGLAGKLLVDLIGLAFIFLSVTGLIYFFFPKWIKRRKRNLKTNLQLSRVFRFSMKWHNKTGVWMVLFMLITACTGMFLRPPLLIPIAGIMVKPIPFTVLDQVNPWHDRLRGMAWNENAGELAIGTVEGIYLVDDELSGIPRKPKIQPPISVMGINEFRHLSQGVYLIGSFSGLFVWAPEKGIVADYFSKLPISQDNSLGRPVSETMVTALYEDSNNGTFYFDYNAGAVSVGHANNFTEMPGMIKNSPMSLWNLALEVHTARIFKVIFGPFYILFIPLFALFSVIILLTGTLLWIKKLINQS